MFHYLGSPRLLCPLQEKRFFPSIDVDCAGLKLKLGLRVVLFVSKTDNILNCSERQDSASTFDAVDFSALGSVSGQRTRRAHLVGGIELPKWVR